MNDTRRKMLGAAAAAQAAGFRIDTRSLPDVAPIKRKPIGSPGMEQGPPQPYATMAFDERRAWVFGRH